MVIKMELISFYYKISKYDFSFLTFFLFNLFPVFKIENREFYFYK